MRLGFLRHVAAAALVLLGGCRTGADRPAGQAPVSASAPIVLEDGPVPMKAATLLWPGRDAVGLVPRETQIFATREPADQARQVVGFLLGAPPDESVVAPFPAGTKLTSLFVDSRGIAYVSLSREAVDGAPGGSAWEQLAVHSLVGSLTRAVPQVRRAQILVEGKEIESLTGHLDLRGPVAFDESLIAP